MLKNNIMGLTGHTFDLIKKHCNMEGSMLELGDQIIYFGDQYGTYSTPYFKQHYPKLKHVCIDIKPEKHAVEKDLRKPLNMGKFDSITNAGTTEHVVSREGFYNSFKHIHESCEVGGVMVHENPKIGNWKGHGDHYVTLAFYVDLAESMGYEIIQFGEHPAMGNTTDGWNIYCVLKKIDDRKFISFKEFDQYDYREN